MVEPPSCEKAVLNGIKIPTQKIAIVK